MNFLKNNKYSDIYEILCIIIVFGFLSVFFSGHYQSIFTDMGREMIIPEGILHGKVLYKDILCIYSPLAYLINALGFKLFGVNISVLTSFGIINSCIFTVFFYLISKEFFTKRFSALLTLTITLSCVLGSGLFNFVFPYSYSMTYGLTGYIISVYLAVLYLKTDNAKFITAAFLISGYSFVCKSEFLPLIIILFCVTLFVKPRSVRENLLNLSAFLTIPVITLLILFYQGLTLNELLSAAHFMKVFFTTPSMIFHITRSGGLFGIQTISLYKTAVPYIITVLLFIYAFGFVTKKFRPFLYIAPVLLVFVFNKTILTFHFMFLPIILALLLIIKAKTFIRKPELALITASSLGVAIRTFWAFQISVYGNFALPLLLIALFAILKEFSPVIKPFDKEDMKTVYKMTIYGYCLYFAIFNITNFYKYNSEIKTEKGTIYTTKDHSKINNTIIEYLKKYTAPKDKVLILPEGTAINFLADRPVDLRMHMADRLYYDALGDEKVLQNIREADYEVIVFLEGFDLTKFGKPYLYDENNPVVKYVKENYILYMQINDLKGKVYLYQKPD